MNPNATITDEMFEAYLKQIRELVEGPFEEMQKEIEVTNKFPDEFYELAKENDLYRFYLPAEYGGWNLDELEILRVQEEFSRGPGGMRMHLHHGSSLTPTAPITPTLLRSPIRKTTRTRAFLHSSYRLMLLAMSSFRCLT